MRRQGGDHARMTVRDAGAGFDRQIMDKLVEAFYTTKSDRMGIDSRSLHRRETSRISWQTE
jgi:C4-dicarboxylate-specific signal transduction histidine kinase